MEYVYAIVAIVGMIWVIMDCVTGAKRKRESDKKFEQIMQKNSI